MKGLQPYLSLVRVFALSLTRLGGRVVRQLVLPGHRRPGNLLSSLFLLFTGVAEQAIAFRRALIRMLPCALDIKIPARPKLDIAWSYSKRYIRLGVIAASWILFILSSLEWSGPGQSGVATSDAPISVTERRISDPAALVVDHHRPLQPAINTASPVLPAIPRQDVPIRRWLQLCTLRI